MHDKIGGGGRSRAEHEQKVSAKLKVFYKLLETFQVVSECKTDLYFERCLIQRLPKGTAVITVSTKLSVASCDS